MGSSGASPHRPTRSRARLRPTGEVARYGTHFCARPGTITDGSSGAVACDHYHRWESDLDLMHSLGIGSYRFSIAWPRVLPEGRGPVNRRGLDFYDRLVDGLLARGISPVATLYHWDLPQALQDRGGWENRDSAEWFADYATVLFEALGDRVSQWLTINEAKVIAEQGYQYGRMAPGRSDLRASGTVIHHLNLAHGRAVAAFRGIRGIGRIGPCLQLAPCYPADDSPEAEAAAMAADTTENTLYLDPLLRGRYPDLSHTNRRVAAGIEAATKDGDLAAIAAPVDFLGVNYYTPVVIDGQGRPFQPHPISSAGWQQIYPHGLYDVLVRLRRDYASPEVLITENGVPDDVTDSSQTTADRARVDFLRRHLRAVHQAIGEGCRVTGYHAWSSVGQLRMGCRLQPTLGTCPGGFQHPCPQPQDLRVVVLRRCSQQQHPGRLAKPGTCRADQDHKRLDHPIRKEQPGALT